MTRTGNNENVDFTYLKCFLYVRNVAGIPIRNGVGARSSCSAQLIQLGSSGMAGNMYSRGYSIATSAITDIDNAL